MSDQIRVDTSRPATYLQPTDQKKFFISHVQKDFIDSYSKAEQAGACSCLINVISSVFRCLLCPFIAIFNWIAGLCESSLADRILSDPAGVLEGIKKIDNYKEPWMYPGLREKALLIQLIQELLKDPKTFRTFLSNLAENQKLDKNKYQPLMESKLGKVLDAFWLLNASVKVDVELSPEALKSEIGKYLRLVLRKEFQLSEGFLTRLLENRVWREDLVRKQTYHFDIDSETIVELSDRHTDLVAQLANNNDFYRAFVTNGAFKTNRDDVIISLIKQMATNAKTFRESLIAFGRVYNKGHSDGLHSRCLLDGDNMPLVMLLICFKDGLCSSEFRDLDVLSVDQSTQLVEDFLRPLLEEYSYLRRSPEKVTELFQAALSS